MTDFEMRSTLQERHHIVAKLPRNGVRTERRDVLIEMATELARQWADARGLQISLSVVEFPAPGALRAVGVSWTVDVGVATTTSDGTDDPGGGEDDRAWTWSARAKDWAHTLAEVARPVLRALPNADGCTVIPLRTHERNVEHADTMLFDHVRDAMADFDVDPVAHDDGTVSFGGGAAWEDAPAMYVGGPPMPNALIGAPVRATHPSQIDDLTLHHRPEAYGLPPRPPKASQSRLDTDADTSCRPEVDPWLER